MEPSSLAMPLELRPATIKPVSTGPSSRTIENATSLPVNESDPNCCSVPEVCNASTAPVKKPVRTTIGNEPTPIRSACCSVSSTYRGRAKTFESERPASREYSCTASTWSFANSVGENSGMLWSKRLSPQYTRAGDCDKLRFDFVRLLECNLCDICRGHSCDLVCL